MSTAVGLSGLPDRISAALHLDGWVYRTLWSTSVSSFLLKFIVQLSREFLRRLAYGSMVGALLVTLVVSSSGWHAAGAAFAHADLAASEFVGALLGHAQPPLPDVVVLAIDDEAYSEFFQAHSPLDRDKLRNLLQAVLTATPQSTQVVVDLDTSPAVVTVHDGAVRAADALDRLLVAQSHRLILARPVNVRQATTLAWLSGLEAQGVRFGQSSVGHVFGLVDFKYDWPDSLAALAARPLCPDCRLKVTMPAATPADGTNAILSVASSPSVLGNPVTLVWRKDTPELLKSLSPKAVVVGGTWGADDVFETPFGPRRGVQLHAAKLAGHLEGRQTMPAYAQVLMAIGIAALAVSSARLWAQWLARYRPGFVLRRRWLPDAPPKGAWVWRVEPDETLLALQQDPGRAFMVGSFRRLLVLLWCVVLLLLVYLSLAALNHFAGFWFPCLLSIGFAVFALTASWVTDITRDLQIENPVLLVKIQPELDGTQDLSLNDLALLAQAPSLRISTSTPSLQSLPFAGQLKEEMVLLRAEFLAPLRKGYDRLCIHVRHLRGGIGLRDAWPELLGIFWILLQFVGRTLVPCAAFIRLLY